MEGPARVARCSTAVVVSHAMDQQWTPLDTTYHERLWAFLRQKGQLLSHCQIPYTPWDYHICRSVDPPNHHPWPDRQSYGSPMERLGIIYCGGSKERPSHPRTSDGTSIGKKRPERPWPGRFIRSPPGQPWVGVEVLAGWKVRGVCVKTLLDRPGSLFCSCSAAKPPGS